LKPAMDKKQALRQELAKRRDDLGEMVRTEASKTIANMVVDRFLAHRLIAEDRRQIVSGFHPFRSELDCRPLLSALGEAGCATALPIIVASDQPLAFRQWTPGEMLELGVWNIPVPLASAETLVPDILLVPLLGFDRAGYRVGYGGGYYDRTIAALRTVKEITAIGLAFSVQEIDEVPREAHDMALDCVLTETGLIRTGE
jgi:5-formyltetrahydrofolate cyclo-ligase